MKEGILNSCHQDVNKKRKTEKKEAPTFPLWYRDAAMDAMEEYAQKKVAEYLQRMRDRISEEYSSPDCEYPITVWLDRLDEYVGELMQEYKFVEPK